MALCCFIPSQRLRALLRRGQTLHMGCRAHGLPLPSPVPAKRMGCSWPPWCQKLLLATTWHAGFHPAGEASIWASLHMVVLLFWLLVFKRALLKQILPMEFFPLLSYHCHSISHWDALSFFFFIHSTERYPLVSS